MIALDLCQAHYQVLLIIYLKFTAKVVEIKTENLNVSLKDIKITNSFYVCSKFKKRQLKSINGLIKNFPNTHEFVIETLINLFCY